VTHLESLGQYCPIGFHIFWLHSSFLFERYLAFDLKLIITQKPRLEFGELGYLKELSEIYILVFLSTTKKFQDSLLKSYFKLENS
jgi:hypothetical protein